LIDEIGSHLHPRWQMRVIQGLRQTFPRVQFIVTTHYPLCLRGLFNRELVVLQRTPHNKVLAVDRDLPPIEGMRVDQLLTSEYFGLNSTIDPDLESQFSEYYQLLALAGAGADPTCGADIRRKVPIAAAPANPLHWAVGFLAQEPAIVSLEERKDLKDETRRKVTEMWLNVKGKE
jgi:hypothetical protein